MTQEQIRHDFEQDHPNIHPLLEWDGSQYISHTTGDVTDLAADINAALDIYRKAHARYAGGGEAGLLEYILQDDIQNRLTPRVVDIAYTAFLLGKEPNSEDGGPSDWFNDTRPTVMKAISQLRTELLPYPVDPAPAVPDADDFAAEVSVIMQGEWNDFCEDAGCIPQDFKIHGPATTSVSFGAGEWAFRVGKNIHAMIAASKEGKK